MNKIEILKEKMLDAKKQYDKFIEKYSVELTDEEVESSPFSVMLKIGATKGSSLNLKTKEDYDKVDELRENYNKTLYEYNKVLVENTKN